MYEYKFVCHNCGEYFVTQETFETFCRATDRNTELVIIQQAVWKGGIGVIEFQDACPRCAPHFGQSRGVIKIRWPQDQQT